MRVMGSVAARAWTTAAVPSDEPSSDTTKWTLRSEAVATWWNSLSVAPIESASLCAGRTTSMTSS